MKELTFKKVQEIADKNEWSMTKYENVFCLETFTSQGQNVIIEYEANKPQDLVRHIKDRYCNFDISEEASYWLENGHGINGAPYEMQDVLDDMKEAKNLIGELLISIEAE